MAGEASDRSNPEKRRKKWFRDDFDGSDRPSSTGGADDYNDNPMEDDDDEAEFGVEQVEKIRRTARSLSKRESAQLGKSANLTRLEQEEKMKADAKEFHREEMKTVRFFVRADVLGTLEVLQSYFELLKASPHSAHVNVALVRSELGNFTEMDIERASELGLHCIGFNVSLPAKAKTMATKRKVDVMCSDVVFKLFDHIREQVSAAMPHYAISHIYGTASIEKLIGIHLSRIALKRMLQVSIPAQLA